MTLDGTPVTDAGLYDLAASVRNGKAKTTAEYELACWAMSMHARLKKARESKLAAERELDWLRSVLAIRQKNATA